MAEEQEERKQPDVAREYSDDRITVRWSPQYCIHVANCLTMQPGVFDSMRRPWIVLDEAGADDIAEAVMSCPTGALTFERHDGGEQEAGPDETVVMPRPNGPIFVAGKLKFVDVQGNVVREATRVALCRCGGSENKPFCDGTHRRNGFRAPA